MFMLFLFAIFHSLVIATNLKAKNSYRSLHVVTLHLQKKNLINHTVTCTVVRVTKMTGSRWDDCIYWHFGYNPS
jgi:hypothetical protein